MLHYNSHFDLNFKGRLSTLKCSIPPKLLAGSNIVNQNSIIIIPKSIVLIDLLLISKLLLFVNVVF